MGEIVLILLTDVDEKLIETLKRRLEEAFDVPVSVRYKITDLRYAYDIYRNQYKSPLILSRLQRLRKGPDDKIIGVVDVDLYSPGYEFIYGEAKQSSGTATLSIYPLFPRNRPGRYNSEVFKQRVIREGLHEVGHLYGLGHCKKPKCLMRTCTCVQEVDAAGNSFCPGCGRRLKRLLENPNWG